MQKSLLDTDTLSEIIKGKNANVLKNAESYLEIWPNFSLCSVTVYEILYGLGAKSADAQIARFLSLLSFHEEIVPTADDYRLAAQMRAALHRNGKPIGVADPIIAACCLAARLAARDIEYTPLLFHSGCRVCASSPRLARRKPERRV